MTKHFLGLTLKETFTKFQIQHPDEKVALSVFCNLCPPNVLLRHQMPSNVCQCKYHTNIEYLIEAVNKSVPEFPKNRHQLLEYIGLPRGH